MIKQGDFVRYKCRVGYVVEIDRHEDYVGIYDVEEIMIMAGLPCGGSNRLVDYWPRSALELDRVSSQNDKDDFVRCLKAWGLIES